MITQYVLKFPIPIIAEILTSIHSYIKLREHVHKNTIGAIDKQNNNKNKTKKKPPKFAMESQSAVLSCFRQCKI